MDKFKKWWVKQNFEWKVWDKGRVTHTHKIPENLGRYIWDEAQKDILKNNAVYKSALQEITELSAARQDEGCNIALNALDSQG